MWGHRSMSINVSSRRQMALVMRELRSNVPPDKRVMLSVSWENRMPEHVNTGTMLRDLLTEACQAMPSLWSLSIRGFLPMPLPDLVLQRVTQLTLRMPATKPLLDFCVLGHFLRLRSLTLVATTADGSYASMSSLALADVQTLESICLDNIYQAR